MVAGGKLVVRGKLVAAAGRLLAMGAARRLAAMVAQQWPVLEVVAQGEHALVSQLSARVERAIPSAALA